MLCLHTLATKFEDKFRRTGCRRLPHCGFEEAEVLMSRLARRGKWYKVYLNWMEKNADDAFLELQKTE
jgi:hypothetical protein